MMMKEEEGARGGGRRRRGATNAGIKPRKSSPAPSTSSRTATTNAANANAASVEVNDYILLFSMFVCLFVCVMRIDVERSGADDWRTFLASSRSRSRSLFCFLYNIESKLIVFFLISSRID